MGTGREKAINKRSWVVLAAAVVLALVISGVTAVLPIYFAVPRFIYANVVSVVLVALAGGPVAGMGYGLLSSLILNSMGMGSGAMLNILIFQMIEGAVIGFMLYKKKKYILVWFSITILLCTLVLKLISFVLYYFLGSTDTEGSLVSYISSAYRYYVSDGLAANMITYALSLSIAAVLYYLLNMIIKSKKKERGEL